MVSKEKNKGSNICPAENESREKWPHKNFALGASFKIGIDDENSIS